MRSTPLAVFWDMDGTIVDTEPFWMRAEAAMVESFGGTWTEADGLNLVGRGLEDSAEILRAAGVRREVDDIVESLTDDVTAALRAEGALFRPGAVELMRSLREAGVCQGLVTMSLRRMAESVIEQIGFDVFDVVITGDIATRPKPHPEPYLQAAAALGVDVAETVVIEDSPGGLRSGLTSGAVTLGVPNFVPLAGLGAHALWPTLAGRTASDLDDLYTEHRSTAATENAR